MLGTIGSFIAYPIVGNILSNQLKRTADWALKNSGKLFSSLKASGRASLSVIKSGAKIKSYQDLRTRYLKTYRENFDSINRRVSQSTERFRQTIAKGYERRVNTISRKLGGRSNFARKVVKGAIKGEVRFLPMTYVMYKAEQMQGNIPADQGFLGYYATTGLPLSLGFSAGFDIAKRSLKMAKMAAFSAKSSVFGLEAIAKVGVESLHNLNKMTKGMFAVYDNAMSKFVSANQTFKAFGSTTAALKAIGRSVHQVNAKKARRSDISIIDSKVRDAEFKDKNSLYDSYAELMGDVRASDSSVMRESGRRTAKGQLLYEDIATGEGKELQRTGFNKKFADAHRRLRKLSGAKYYGDDVGYTGTKVLRSSPVSRSENLAIASEDTVRQYTQDRAKIDFLGGRYDLGVFHIDSIRDSMDKIATQFLNIANRPWLNFLDAGNHWLQSSKTKALTKGIQKGKGVVGLQGQTIELITYARTDRELIEEYQKGGNKVSAAKKAIQLMTKAEESVAESYLVAKQNQAVEYARITGKWNKFGAEKGNEDAVREFVADKIAFGVITRGEWSLGNGDVLDVVGRYAKVHTKLADGNKATFILHSGDAPIQGIKLLRGDTRAGQIAGGLLGGKASITGSGGVEIESGIESTTNISHRKYYADSENTRLTRFITKIGDLLEWGGGHEQSLFGKVKSVFTKYKNPSYVGKVVGDLKRGSLDRERLEELMRKGDPSAVEMVKGFNSYSKKLMGGVFASMRATDMAEGAADPSKKLTSMFSKMMYEVRKTGKLSAQDEALTRPDSFDINKAVINDSDSMTDILNKLRYTNDFFSHHETYLRDVHGFDEGPLRQLQELLESSKDRTRVSALSGSLSGNGDRVDRYNKQIFDFLISISSSNKHTRDSAARAISEIASSGVGRISSAKLRLGETNMNGISAAMHMSTVGNSYAHGESVDRMTQSELAASIETLAGTFLGSGRANLRETFSTFGSKKRVKEAPGAENKFVLVFDDVAKKTGARKSNIIVNGTNIDVREAPIKRSEIEQLAAVGTMNSALSMIGLGFDLQSTFTVSDIVKKTLTKRVLPIGLLFGAHDLMTSAIQQTPILRDTSLAGGVTGVLWDAYAGARVLSQTVSDFTGITSVAQKMEELVPGSIDSPLSGLIRGILPIGMGLKIGNMGRIGPIKGGMIGAGIGMLLGGGPLGLFDDSWNLAKGREQVIAELSGEKEVQVSKGRFWELSGSAFWGDKISYFRPSLYALQKKQYQRSDNYIGDSLVDMVQSYIDPGVYAEKHYFSRPYEMVGGKLSNIPLIGTSIDALVGGSRYMHQDFLQEMSQSSLLAGGPVPGLKYSGSLQSTTPISSGRGAFYGGSMVGGTSVSSLPVMSPTSFGAAADTTIDNMLDVAGLRGFMLGNVVDAATGQGASGFSGGFRTESANDIASFSKSYWEKELGGIVGLCLHEDSEVLTNKGLVKIKNIEPDIEVLTPNGFKKVIGKTSRRLTSTESSFTIKTKLGEITATEDHKIFVLESEFCKHDKYVTCSPLVSCKKQRCKEYSNVKKVLWKPIKEITTDNWVGFPVIEGLEQKDFIIDFAEGTNYKAVGNRLFKKSSTDDLITCLEHLDKNGYIGKRTLAKKLGVAVSVATSACSAFKSEWSIRKRFYHLDEEMQKEFFWFLGLYCGDGSTYKWTTEITIGWKNRRVFRKRLIRLFNALGIEWSWKIGKFNSWGSFRINGPLSDWLNFHMGKGFASKRIPKMVWESYITNRLSFIGGFIDSNGCLTTRDQNITIAVKNINLAKELNSLYLTCGIWSKFRSSFEIGIVDVPFSYSYLLTNYSEKCKVLNNKIVKNVTGVFIENNILFAKVISSTKNKVDVSYYDIEVDDPSHCFVANNIICHNSEGIRRIFPNPSPGDTERINRIANAMPLWLPGKDSFIDYLTGDPYNKVQMGEVRLPGKCILPDSLVMTSEGMVPAEDIQVGQQVLTSKGFYPITNVFTRNVNENVRKISVYGGPSLSLTEEHEVLTIKTTKCKYHKIGSLNRRPCKPFINKSFCNKLKCIDSMDYMYQWVPAKSVEEGDYVVMPKADLPNFATRSYIDLKEILSNYNWIVNVKNNEWRFLRSHKNKTIFHQKQLILPDRIFLTDDLMYIFGFYCAEGHISSAGVHFTCSLAEKQILEFIVVTLKKIFGEVFTFNIVSKKKWNENAFVLNIYSKVIKSVFEEVVGSTDSKKLPLCYSNIIPFLSGLFEGDGHVVKEQVALTASLKYKYTKELPLLFSVLNIPYTIIEKEEESVWIIKVDSNLFLNYPFKVKSCPTVQTLSKTKTHIVLEDRILLKVRKNEIKEYRGMVYDYEVRGPHNFVTSFVIHNSYESMHNVYYTYPIDSMVMGKSYEEQVSFYAGDVTYLSSLRRNWHVVERTRKELIGELKKTMPIIKEADVAYDVRNDVHSYVDAVMQDEKGLKTAIAVVPMIDNYADPGGAAQLNAYLVNNTKDIKQGLLIAMDKDGNISKQIIYADTKKYLNDVKIAQSAARQASKITKDLQEEGYSVNRWPAYSHLNRLQILVNVAPFSKEAQLEMKIVKQQVDAGMLGDKEMQTYKNIMDQFVKRLNSQKTQEYKFLPLIMGKTPVGTEAIKLREEAEKYSKPEQLIGAAGEYITHLRNPIFNKLIGKKSMYEQYREDIALGKGFTKWQNPIEDYVAANLSLIAAEEDPLQAALSGATGGFIFGGPIGAGLGAGAAGFASLFGLTRNTRAGRMQELDDVQALADALKYKEASDLEDEYESKDRRFTLRKKSSAYYAYTEGAEAGEVAGFNDVTGSLSAAERSYVRRMMQNMHKEDIEKIAPLLPTHTQGLFISYATGQTPDTSSYQKYLTDSRRIVEGALLQFRSDDMVYKTLQTRGLDAHGLGLGWAQQVNRVKYMENSRGMEVPTLNEDANYPGFIPGFGAVARL